MYTSLVDASNLTSNHSFDITFDKKKMNTSELCMSVKAYKSCQIVWKGVNITWTLPLRCVTANSYPMEPTHLYNCASSIDKECKDDENEKNDQLTGG